CASLRDAQAGMAVYPGPVRAIHIRHRWWDYTNHLKRGRQFPSPHLLASYVVLCSTDLPALAG
ncbi:MAG: hypothetical protein M1546_23355, partial [Chloroflexi bacterium]|nr:hypothetical protein [Chloroflexota bacterium]